MRYIMKKSITDINICVEEKKALMLSCAIIVSKIIFTQLVTYETTANSIVFSWNIQNSQLSSPAINILCTMIKLFA
jgi:hypothetical protein